MSRPSPAQAVRQAEVILKGWLDGDATFERALGGRDAGVDLIVRQGRSVLVVEVKVIGDSGSVTPAIHQALEDAARVRKGAVPVVVVPFMAESGRRLCEQTGVSWFDLSGNARDHRAWASDSHRGQAEQVQEAGAPFDCIRATQL